MDDYRRMEEQDQYKSLGLDDSMEDERDLDQIRADRRAAEMELDARETRFGISSQRKLPQLLHDQGVFCCQSAEKRKSPMERAMYEYLIGKVLDVSSDYRKDADDHLSKAVKLNPSLGDAWLSLGNCIWKKGDLSKANN